ncbi:hypothetical protein B5F90_08715 [Alistipes sp. An31A]|uniref:hypothetical protein n=1 Tax=Alistipes sp. An31A TaxID=1965631 RepID=UPI000B366B2C|nr:hypothetical protein [Alistipes sp. An31A]OUO19389.1 hypothetical protein B5F90_08715 [Alistipes sp. An31A]
MNSKSICRLLALLTAALAACSEPSEVYYTTRYEVTAIEAAVSVTEETPTEPTDPENPGTELGDGSDGEGTGGSDNTGSGSGSGGSDGSEGSAGTGGGSGSDGSEGSEGSEGGEGTEGGEGSATPLADAIRAAVLASAPVQVGGSYTLDYVEYNGGRLTVRPTADGEALSGAFVKLPGSTDITLYYGGDQERRCTLSYYTDAEGQRLARFGEDLTEQFRALYPDADIQSVVRYEQTSHIYY